MRKSPQEHIRDTSIVEFEHYIKDIWAFLPTPIAYVSPLGVILDLDTTMEEMIRSSKDTLVGRLLADFFVDKEKIGELQRLTLQNGVVRNFFCELKSNSNLRIPVSVSTLVRRTRQGEIIGYFAAFTDISENRRIEEVLRKTTSYQKEMLETARYLVESLDVTEVLTRIASSARTMIRADGCAIYLLESDKKTLKPVVAIDPPYEEAILATPLNIDTSFTGKAIEAKKAMIFNNTGSDPRGQHIPGTPDEENEHAITAPFIVDGQILGAMCLDRTGTEFTDNELVITEVFATYAATALRNARTYYDLQQEVKAREEVQKSLRIETGYLEQLFASAQEGIAMLDCDGVVQRINSEFSRIFGYASDEAIGKSIDDLIVPADYFQDARAITRRALNGESVALEATRRRKYGTLIDVSVLASPIIINKNQVGVYAIYRDITARKQAERKLRESEDRYRTLVNTTPEAVTVTDLEGKITYVAPQTLTLHGYDKPKDLLGKSAFEMIDPKDHKKAMANMKKTFEKGIVRDVEYVLLKNDGTHFHGELNASLIRDGHGKPIAFVATTRDITERKRAVRALKDSEEKYRNLFHSSNDAIFIHDVAGNITDANSRAEALFGYKKAEILEMTVANFHPADQVAKSAKAFKDIVKDGFVNFEIYFKKKDSSVFPAEVSASLFEIGDRKWIQGVVRDISDRKQSEMKLRESEERYRDLVEKAGAAILLIDRDGKFSYYNKRFAELLGYSFDEMGKKELESIVHPDDFERVVRIRQALIQGKTETFRHEFRGVRSDGGIVYLECDATAMRDDGSIIGTRSYIWDVTLRKTAEEEIKNSEERLKLLFEYAPDGYFLTDLKGNFLDGNKAIEEIVGYKKHELIGKSFVKAKLLSSDQIPSIYELLARNAMGHRTGPDEFTLTRKDGSKTIVGIRTYPVKIDGKTVVLGIARDMTDYKRTQEELRKSYDRMQKVLEDTINALTSAVEKRDPYTAGHQHRVAILADAIAKKMKLPSHQKEGLHVAALVHDIGKINVPAGILNKPSSLSDAEFALVKDHVLVGYDILRTIEFPWQVAEIVFQHHERLDGSGYPMGLKGSDILMEAKILAVADVVESMMAHRPYRPARGKDKAITEIKVNKKKLYDVKIVKACLKVLSDTGFHF
ncbi:MAG: PAS domain S-box protein [candidate division WOR-3 bacterium]|nr:PAS domain S-box protein [candidate division WOR-3 bacterium]